jgi:hypothetical protein
MDVSELAAGMLILRKRNKHAWECLFPAALFTQLKGDSNEINVVQCMDITTHELPPASKQNDLHSFHRLGGGEVYIHRDRCAL